MRNIKDCKETEYKEREPSAEEESDKEDKDDSGTEVGFGVFRADESGNLVQVGFGQPKDPAISPSASFQSPEELPERGWGKSFLQQQSSAFGSFHENPNPFLVPGQMLTRPSQSSLSFGRGGGSAGSSGGFPPAGPSLPPQEALFSSIKMKDKVARPQLKHRHSPKSLQLFQG